MTPEASLFIQLIGQHRQLSAVARGARRGSTRSKIWREYTGNMEEGTDLEFLLDRFEEADHPDLEAMERAFSFSWLPADAFPPPDFDWESLVRD